MHSVFQLDHSLHAYVGVGVVVVVNGIAWDVEFSVGVVVVTVTGCDDVVTAIVGTITQASNSQDSMLIFLFQGEPLHC